MVRRLNDYTKLVRDFYAEVTGKKKIAPAEYLEEKAKSGKSNWGMQLLDPNPDALVDAKGQGVKIYQDMLRDPYVKAALNNKKQAILAHDWRIVPPEEDDESAEQAKLLEDNLDDLEGQTFKGVMWGMLDALDCGYSITEKIMKLVGNRYDYRKFKSLDTYYYVFGTDDFGNVREIVADSVKGMQKESFDPRFFAVWTYQPRYSNPYGTSDLRAAHRPFWIKDTAWKFRCLYIERYGVPPLIGKVKPGTSETVKDDLFAVLKQVQSESNIVLPDDMVVEVLSTAMSPTTEYEAIIKQLNKEILVGILGSFMGVEEGSDTGARALGEVHERTEDKGALFIATHLEDTINEQIVRPWYDMNFPNIEQYGRFEFVIEDEFDREKEARTLAILTRAGLKIAAKQVRDKFGFAAPEEDEEVLVAPALPTFGNPDEQEQSSMSDDTALIKFRESFWPRLEGLYTTIAADCFEAVKKSGVLDGDIVKAKDMPLPINVGAAKRALADIAMYGNLLGRGSEPNLNANRDQLLIDAGMDSESFAEANRRYEEESYRLAGALKQRLESDFRRELLAIVASGGTEKDIWTRFSDVVNERHGIGNYVDAVDIEAISLGYNDGLKEKLKD